MINLKPLNSFQTYCTLAERREGAKERVWGIIESQQTLSRRASRDSRKLGREREISRRYVPLLEDKKIGNKSLEINKPFNKKGGSSYR